MQCTRCFDLLLCQHWHSCAGFNICRCCGTVVGVKTVPYCTGTFPCCCAMTVCPVVEIVSHHNTNFSLIALLQWLPMFIPFVPMLWQAASNFWLWLIFLITCWISLCTSHQSLVSHVQKLHHNAVWGKLLVAAHCSCIPMLCTCKNPTSCCFFACHMCIECTWKSNKLQFALSNTPWCKVGWFDQDFIRHWPVGGVLNFHTCRNVTNEAIILQAVVMHQMWQCTEISNMCDKSTATKCNFSIHCDGMVSENFEDQSWVSQHK